MNAGWTQDTIAISDTPRSLWGRREGKRASASSFSARQFDFSLASFSALFKSSGRKKRGRPRRRKERSAMASEEDRESHVCIAKPAEQDDLERLSSGNSEESKSQSVESSNDKENICMNDAPESIVKHKSFLVSDMNDAPESSIVAGNKKDEHDSTFTSCKNSTSVSTGIIVDSYIPAEGMQFDSEDDAYHFYNDYALKHGFSVRKFSWDRNAKGVVVRKTFVCSKQGWKNSSANPRTRKPDTRCGCPARIVLRRLSDGKFVVRTFVCGHNHPLAPSSMSHLLRSHRKVTSLHLATSAISELADNVGITPKETDNDFVKENNDPDNVPLIAMDDRNLLGTKRTKTMKNSEICALVDYLQKKSSEDLGFYNAMQLDEDGYATNIFWADSRARVDYACFSDVLVFDTTIKMNSHQWPFVQFVGVNHHSQSCIFGSAFLYNETIETIEWLFRVFTEAMNGKHPQTVLTDGDNAIAVAVSHIWPNAHHRFCLWHILQNAGKNIGDILDQKMGFKESFTRWIFQCEDDDTFRSAWEQMVHFYNLEENIWLQKLYEDKEKWALAYGRQYFCADMINTQRAESLCVCSGQLVHQLHDGSNFRISWSSKPPLLFGLASDCEEGRFM
ncbi:protein FAR1-RELATED SEQUENCE 5-like isoform X4 [Nymphaea colorata]|uniref:protein FAR1-RELATED SEQUENCE 5-like isoform X4 n=1 Tax=Nymphaea colorata TaxID=210225 RepID=UPI00129DC365|nr:protein FAR1-RELATED SEQUENCE 5-like isoform X4 [Nymphaea colorata]XP_031504221.1 protein FAR1-RELATED SEQUENCE 5-like isoform X4 [Nymphaea colorata]XP_031504222.1 protein FAR1-RELATED SEQUENCE 5-like isoform X4 [Nymphaea colorata]